MMLFWSLYVGNIVSIKNWPHEISLIVTGKKSKKNVDVQAFQKALHFQMNDLVSAYILYPSYR